MSRPASPPPSTSTRTCVRSPKAPRTERSTAARLSVCERDVVGSATENRSHPLLIVDAGIPRNVDPAVAELPHVRLLNLDALDREQERTLAARRREIPRVEIILNQELERWRRWCARRAERYPLYASETVPERPLPAEARGMSGLVALEA